MWLREDESRSAEDLVAYHGMCGAYELASWTRRFSGSSWNRCATRSVISRPHVDLHPASKEFVERRLVGVRKGSMVVVLLDEMSCFYGVFGQAIRL